MKKLQFLLKCIILLSFLASPAFAADDSKPVLTDIRTSFTGIKTTIVFEFKSKPDYEIEEDWLEQSIEVRFSDINSAGYGKNRNIPVGNHIVERIEITRQEENSARATIVTNKDFILEKFELDNPFRIVLEVSMIHHEITPYFYYNRGAIYEIRGKRDKAIQQMEKALEIKPDFEKAHFRLGTIYYEQGDYKNAEKHLKKVKEGTYESSMAFQILEEIYNDRKGDETVAMVPENIPSGESDVSKPKQVGNDLDRVEAKISRLAQLVLNENKEEKPKVEIIPKSKKVKRIDFSFITNPLNVLYIICFILFITVVVLFKRLLKTFKMSSEVKKKTIRRTKTHKPVKEKSFEKTVYPSAGFSKKLDEFYSKTDVFQKQITHKKDKKDIRDIPLARAEPKFVSYEPGEAVNLIKKFKGSDSSIGINREVLSAIYELSEKNWYPWEIAKELNLGTEEVKMALNLKHQKIEEKQASLKEQIQKLYYNNEDIKNIAKKLSIGEEEVNLSVKMINENREVYNYVS